MAKSKKAQKVVYVVFEGRRPGLYSRWTDAEAQIKGYARAVHRGYTEGEGGWHRANKASGLSTKACTNPTHSSHNPPPQPPLGRPRPRPQSWASASTHVRKLPRLDDEHDEGATHSIDQVPVRNMRYPWSRGGDATPGTESEDASSSDTDNHNNQGRRVVNDKRSVISRVNAGNSFSDTTDPTSQDDADDTMASLTQPKPRDMAQPRNAKRANKQRKDQPSGDMAEGADFIPLGATDDDDDDLNERFFDASESNTADVTSISHLSNTDASLVEKPMEPELTAEQQALVDTILSGKNVFYTGSAGTGKSTVLKAFKSKLQKAGKVVDIIAPTGIAALQIGGVTSFVYAGWSVSSQQRPLEELEHNATFQKRVHKRLCKTDVLVIDEISMVENHHFARLDAIMRASRSYNKHNEAESDSEGEEVKEGDPRNRSLPFGGVQLVVTGDFCQLPPVKPFQHCLACGSEMKPSPKCTPERYDCPKCKATFKDKEKWAFCSAAWQECDFHYAHLQTIHRQSDPTFVDILQRCRLGQVLTQADRDLLLNHPSDTKKATKLSSRKADVQDINDQEFARLSGPIRTYACFDEWNCRHDYIQDYFSTTSYSGPKIYVGHSLSDSLQLRKGMQVALLANLDPPNGLVNGTIGQVLGFVPVDVNKTPDFKGKDAAHQTESFRRFLQKLKAEGTEEWPLIRFNTDAPGGMTRMVKSVCRTSSHGYPPPSSWASRTQLPLMPAWAMTIHKSQGMTLSKVEIDLAKTFESGQDYVALSRARGLMGLKVTGLRYDMKGGNRQVMAFLREKFGIGEPPESVEDEDPPP